MVLRGDLPSGFGSIGDFPYAVNLIDFIIDEFENYFEIEVGSYPETHPEAVSPEQDLKYFCEKMSREVKEQLLNFSIIQMFILNSLRIAKSLVVVSQLLLE